MEKPSRFLANSSTALEQLRGLINQHESTPGIPLPTERELSNTLGVGRREVRRALDVLEEEGRIWRKQGKGTFIGPAAPVEPLALQGLVQQTNLLEVMEARLQLEPGLARLAALRATRENLALMQRMLERIDKVSPDDRDLNELWDSAFHRAIAEAAGNRLMLGLLMRLMPSAGNPAGSICVNLPARLNVSTATTTTITKSCPRLSIVSLMKQPPRCASTCSAYRPR